MITGGGTGGHLFPGIAVAENFLARFPEGKVMFVGTDRHIDAKALAERLFEKVSVKSRGLKGKSLFSKLHSLLLLPWSLLQALMIVRRFKPSLILGVGGYVTGPVILAAKLLGKATCIHEQNSVPGVTNRMLSKFVDRIFISIPGSEKYFPEHKTVLTGNPIRQELLTHEDDENKEQGDGLTLLILGGSQGAHKVNQLVSEALSTFSELPSNLKIIHQTGRQDEEWVRESYANLEIEVQVKAFFDDMATAYRDADLVLSRAGATSLAEITALNKPAILIPFPFAADNHQEKNAQHLVDGGAAIMFLEKDLTAERLGKEIFSLLQDKDLRKKMAACAGKLAKPHATETIVDQCLALLRQKGFNGAQEAAHV